jgi:putative PIN family toxin of toxin-antitoxin system
MKVVVDTNVVISALLWAGVPHQVLDAAQAKKFELICTEALVDELHNVLSRSKFDKPLAKRALNREELVKGFLEQVTIVEPAPVPEDAVRDPKDAKVLACALDGQASYIVTGDDDLLVLKSYQEIKIVTPAELLNILQVP